MPSCKVCICHLNHATQWARALPEIRGKVAENFVNVIYKVIADSFKII